MSKDRTYTFEELRERLLAHDLKATQQRLVILKEVMSTRQHPSVEHVYEAVKPNNPSISLATVYKTLETFERVKLVHKVLSAEGNMRYDANTEKHSHIYCTNTQEIMDFQDEGLERLIEEFFAKKKIKNLLVKDIKVQINGEKIDPDKNVEIK